MTSHPTGTIHNVWPYAQPDDRARFAGRVHRINDDPDACWIWTGAIESDGGYSRYRPPGGAVIAGHRWSYLAHHGPTAWPVIRHTCDIRPCVNPHHLTAGTQAANIADTLQRGGWTPVARTGPTAWPDLAYRLRDLAVTGDTATLERLTRRPRQLELTFPPAGA